ncbi:MAG: cytochrome b/b6 domain-containing protein, partial [Pseudomonadota bacterium]|nr:cytochrome b/b6 domain-containing protein [Pseudomonadota bacterium]
MPLANSPDRYGSIAKALHWTTALLILALIPMGFIAKNLAIATQTGSPVVSIEVLTTLFSTHKTLGVAVFFVALLRILWALSQPKPRALHPDRRLETLAAETVHWLLYGAIVLVPLTGWIHHAASTGFAPIWGPFGQDLPLVPKSEPLSELFAAFHFAAVVVMVLSLGLHIAGALKHQIIDRDITLARMLPNRQVVAQSGPGAAPETDLGSAAGQSANHTASGSITRDPHQKTTARTSAALAAVVILAAAGVTWITETQDHRDTAPAQASVEPNVAANDNSTSVASSAQQPNASQGDVAQDTSDTNPAPDAVQTTDSATATADLPSWQVAEGALNLSIQQLGNAVNGSFETWQAQILFDPDADPAQMGEIRVEIDIASLSLGTVSAQAMGPDYFDSAAFPTAIYQADLAEIDGTLTATGTLTIKETSVPLAFPVDLTLAESTATASGSFTLDRRDFGIGDTVP